MSGARRPNARFARRLVVMVKEPRAGRVKTRLARDIGVVRATAFYRTTLAVVLARLARPREWRTILAVAPDGALASRALPAGTDRMAQGGGDLGRRMQRVMERLPPGPVVIVGTDIPAISSHHVRTAFARLGSSGAVLGPSPDGGYWLVGLRRTPHVPRAAFAAVRWSSADALADTMRNLSGLPVARLAPLDDVDAATDLVRAGPAVGRRILPVGD